MQPIERGISVKHKTMLMYADSFYMRPEYKSELVSLLEHGAIRSDREAVEFIDQHGEWLWQRRTH